MVEEQNGREVEGVMFVWKEGNSATSARIGIFINSAVRIGIFINSAVRIGIIINSAVRTSDLASSV